MESGNQKITETGLKSDEAVNSTLDHDDVDQLLQEDDPEFLSSLENIGPKEGDEPVDIEIPSLLSDDESFDDDPEEDKNQSFVISEELNWKQKILLAFERKTFILYRKGVQLKIKLFNLLNQLTYFLRTQPLDFFGYLKAILVDGILGQLKSSVQNFRNLRWRDRLVVLAFLFLCGLSLSLAWMNMTGSWLLKSSEGVLVSIEQVADLELVGGEGVQRVALLNYFPEARYTVLFEKVIVNLRRRPGIEENPMGAFEFFISLDSQAAAIELRQRERELLDRVQRAIEENTYPELQGSTGQNRLRQTIRQELGGALTQGRVRDVYINTIVIKP